MLTQLRARLAANPVIVDAVIALGLTVMSIVAIVGGAQDAGSREPLSVGLLLLETLPLVARRRWPMGVLVVVVAATLAHASMASADGVNESLGFLVAIFTVAERLDRRTSLVTTLVVALIIGFLITVKGSFPSNLQGLFQTLLVTGLAWAIGDWARTRRLYASADRERIRLLEFEREELERRAVQAERERIARELHDVVTHHVSVIVIQAGAGLTALDRRPEQARTALAAIDRTARQALTDMRRMLGILGDPADDGEDARAPMPGLDRLGELIEQVRAAGLPVELAIAGDRRPLDAGIELSAYRIVQEALTNVLKHAHGGRARVELSYGERTLDIVITDEGGTGRRDISDGSEGGHGLVGMRERVALFGGVFEAGPTSSGFRVRAYLPAEADVTVAT